MLTSRVFDGELLRPARTTVSSGSSLISVSSSTDRLRRLDLARASCKAAEARALVAESELEEVQAELDFNAGSQAGSVGRRLDDVQSETGSNPARHDPLNSI